MNKVAAKMDRALQLAPHRNLGELYESILGFWERDSGVVQGVPSIDRLVPDLKEMDPNTLPDPETFLMYADTVTYLPDDILTKVDRASMAVSLEARVPLLDHRLTEFVWTLPTSFKITPEGVTKRIMRDVLYKYVPRELIERPKKGFSIPVSSWLRTTLKEWALDLLSSETIKKEGIFNPSLVETFLNEHMQGLRDRDAALWNIIQCRSWLHEVAAAPTPISTPSTPKIVKAEEYRQDRALGVPHAS
jgi:asparagine synthase (glutamine-hydrolysing)